MGSFRIEGGCKLQGEIIPQGAKNEALQILCAVLLTDEEVFSNASKLGREFVIEIEGTVIERKSVNERIKTGEIEILYLASKH